MMLRVLEKVEFVRQMLEALETGHNQFLSSLNPAKLRLLTENYKAPDSVDGKGKNTNLWSTFMGQHNFYSIKNTLWTCYII